MADAPLDKLKTAIEGVLEQNLGQLREQISTTVATSGGEVLGLVQAEATEALQSKADEARQEQAQQTSQDLAQASRRIRAESSVGGIAAALVDAASDYATCAGLFVRKGDQLTGFRARGLAAESGEDGFQRIDFPAGQAQAFRHAVDSKDQVTCAGTENDLSADVVGVFGLAPEARVTLYPIVLRDNVSAILLASGKEADGAINNAAIELLASIAEAWIEAVGTRKTAQLKQKRSA